MNEREKSSADWPVDLNDPEAAAIAESWAAIGQILGATEKPLDAVTAARLVRAVQAHDKRGRSRRLFAVAAVAAVFVLALSPWFVARQISPNTAGRPEPDSSHSTIAATTPSGDAKPPLFAAAINEWDDPLEEEFADVHDYARDVELSWSRADDPFSAMSERMESLQNQWNDSSL